MLYFGCLKELIVAQILNLKYYQQIQILNIFMNIKNNTHT